MTLRTLCFWPHLVAGLVAGLVILLMSVTGVLLTYERQMIAWSDSHYRSAAPAPGASRLPVDRLLAGFRDARPDATATAVTLTSAPDAPVAIAVDQQIVYLDAYTGAVLGEGVRWMRRAMTEIRAWHRWLAVEGEGRPVARAVTGWSNVAFAFLALSGLYLWWPRTWNWAQVKAVLLFNGKARGKARDFNWHNVIGFWSALPLVIVVVSAVPISFPWANAAVYRAMGEEPPAGRGGGGGARGGGSARGGAATRAEMPRRNEGSGPRARAADAPAGGVEAARGTAPASQLSFDDLLMRAARQVAGWRTMTLRLPASPQAPVVVAIDRGDGGQPHLRSTLTLDRSTGVAQSFEAFSAQTPARRVRSLMRFAHTGEVLGLPGQTVAGLVTTGGAVLVWTGLALAWRRLRAWVTRRSRRTRMVTHTARNSAA